MADQEQLNLLRSSVQEWNNWRGSSPHIEIDLGRANLREQHLSTANLRKANLQDADLRWADLGKANLREARLNRAYMHGVNLREADLSEADLSGADLRDAILSGAKLIAAYLRGADLTKADLTKADLTFATLVETRFNEATLVDCKVYGVSSWNVALVGAVQTNLIIRKLGEPTITVDNLDVAQFLYLMLHNDKIRDIIDTLTSKVVLILGRFTPERKQVLDAVREELRQRNYVPVLFDFEGPESHDFTETVTLLARMARFIIADLTEPSSIPQELQAIVPNVVVPVQPLIAQGVRPYAMFRDYRKFHWMLPLYRYTNLEQLLATIQEQVIAPAEAKVIEVHALRQTDNDDES